MSLKKSALAIFLIGAVVGAALGQGPMHKRVNFSINVPYELKKSDIVLPPGNYVLYQISDNAPHLFALYRDNTRHSPIAIISTMRLGYSATGFPSKTRMLMETDESSPDGNKVLEGWNIPGEDGWEAISSVSTRHATVRTK
jgi:hypothetical protein